MTDRTNENIRNIMDLLYRNIREAEEDIKRLRSECPHEHTRVGNVEVG